MVSRTLLVEGSSTSSPDGGLPHAPVKPYHAIYMSDPATINPPITHTNFASGGETLADISKRVPDVITAFAAPPTVNVLTLQLGQNDFVGGGPYANNVAGWIADVETLIGSYRAAVNNLVKIGLTTQNPRNDPTFLGTRSAVNAAIRTIVKNGKADFLIDWAIDPTYSQDADVTNPAKYPDGTHPSQANQKNMEALYYRAALDELSASS